MNGGELSHCQICNDSSFGKQLVSPTFRAAQRRKRPAGGAASRINEQVKQIVQECLRKISQRPVPPEIM